MSLFTKVPKSLRTWFIIHFVVDYLVAVPLFVAPVAVLGWFGWQTVDPLASRLVAAALFGIGGVSYIHRDAKLESFRSMLLLKMLWSGAAVLGAALSYQQGQGALAFGVGIIFLLFFAVWSYYYRLLKAL